MERRGLYEQEVKFEVVSVEDVQRFLERHGFTKLDECVEVDYYYNHPCRSFQTTDEALRLRLRKCTNSVTVALTYKGPRIRGDGHVKKREEIELYFDYQELSKIALLLDRLGFKLVSSFTKTRTLYQNDGLKASIDHLHGVGYYLELELVDELSKQLMTNLVSKLVHELKLKPVEKTYLEICLELATCKAPFTHQ
jgi:adenylate cyclase class 2